MDLRQLQYAEAVARTLNFTRAAHELHVAQPALSQAIANLEAELGTRLFDRTSRRVTLTDAGTLFVARARRILGEVTSLSTEMDEYGRGARGIVRVSTWYHLEPMLPIFLRGFMVENPGLEVSIVELPSRDMLDALRRDEIDLGMALFGPEWDTTEIGYQLVRSDTLVLLTQSGDPLAANSLVALEATANRRFITAHRGTSFRGWFDRSFAELGIEPRIAVETNEAAAAVAYVDAGIGIAFLPSSICPPVMPSIKQVTLAGAPTIDVALAWHETGYRRPAVERALAFARDRATR
jgi:DNA-binding transcriptional LysR family regulator